MRWKNGVAYALLALAAVQYLTSAPVYLGQLEAFRGPYGVEDSRSWFTLALAWLTGPVYVIGWAAVIEYLSRIASALQRANEKTA
jgi:hypothetical protein